MTSQSLLWLLLAVVLGLGSLFGPPSDVPAAPAPSESGTALLATVQAASAPLYTSEDQQTVTATLPQGHPLIVLREGAERLCVRTVEGAEGYVPRYLVRMWPVPEVRGDFIVMGYWMDDGTGAATASLESAADVLTAVSPWSWGVTADGRLRPVYVREQRLGPMLAEAGRHGLRTYALVHNFNPNIGAFDAALADAILDNADVRARAVQNIVDTVARWGMSGIHVDFEGVRPARRDALTAFMAQLASAAHDRGLQVSIAVPAKTATTAHASWTAAYDYGALAEHVDFLMIMAYDQHWRGDVAGPIAAVPWVRSVVEYTLDPAGGAVPAGKVVLGIPVYGYDWPASGWADAVTFQQAMERLQQARRITGNATVLWHPAHAAPYFSYGGRTVWFENEHSIAHKLLLAAEYNLGGVAFWRLGQEDAGVWDLVARLKS